jgi:hypothetical protein
MTWIYVVGSLVAALGAAYALRLAPILRNRRHYEIREIPDFLTPEQGAHLSEQAQPLMVGSSGMQDGVVGVAHSGRTSSSAFLSHAGDRVIRDIKPRLAELTETPIENQEGIQITHYRADEHYEPHFDSLREAEIYPGPSGDRLCTVIRYLNDDYEGGHTPPSLAFAAASSRNGARPCSSTT